MSRAGRPSWTVAARRDSRLDPQLCGGLGVPRAKSWAWRRKGDRPFPAFLQLPLESGRGFDQAKCQASSACFALPGGNIWITGYIRLEAAAAAAANLPRNRLKSMAGCGKNWLSLVT